ncbi:MAG: FMN-binding negative transcriptional regulator [Proteobacteria bacterium]|nr:FMN-binding negative transcriptional regulator [Pseudomonadota bacterium]MBI3497060.1 FMN-binding negative transcriptional regulator [Pseudomonadota bacterium]
MYVPNHFREDDPNELCQLIREHGFGTLIASLEGRIEIAHLPFLIDADQGAHGTLLAHVARANPIHHAFDGKTAAVAVFHGPDSYVSPDWYENRVAVPTWNYAVVHAHGHPAALEDEALTRLLERLSATHEAKLAPKRPWTIDKLPKEMFAGLKKAIVGFSMPIERIEGKFKLSQNRQAPDRLGTIAALEALPGEGAAGVAALMRAREK